MTAGARVGVIGAGISGLVTAKVLLEDGFAVTLLEKESELGGVWAASRTYPGLYANNPRETYAFSDFPYPSTADEFPSALQIRTYLAAYAEHFRVRERIRFGTEVLEVVRTERGFGVVARTAENPRTETLAFDYVVVCNGVFSKPCVPEVENAARFAGAMLHSSAATDPSLCAGRRVLVVGGGKSALDCAAFAAESAASCALLFRRPHWMAPRYFPGRMRMDRMLLTRFAGAFLPYYRLGWLEGLLHHRASGLVRLWWRLMSVLLRRITRMPPALVPDRPLPTGVENLGVVHDAYELVRAGRIQPVRGSLRRVVGARTVELESGERLDADVIIFATGWRQDVSFLDEDIRGHVLRGGRFRLYRMILPPEVPCLGFIGYNSSTACQLSSELGAHWLSQCFRGELSLPSVEEMNRDIDRFHRWAADAFPDRSSGYFLGPHLVAYLDQLMRDMGLSTRRTRRALVEYFGRVWPSRYRDVASERRRARGGGGAALQLPAHGIALRGGIGTEIAGAHRAAQVLRERGMVRADARDRVLDAFRHGETRAFRR
jgi:dimethylaniline monooxygenase (N-oxide forming)